MTLLYSQINMRINKTLSKRHYKIGGDDLIYDIRNETLYA